MSTTIDEQFVEFVVKSLVSKPDAVSIKRTIDEKGVLLELTVDPEDLGRVIGKRGAAAQALRTLLRALGTKNDARYNLKIVDVGGERPRREERDDREENNNKAPKAKAEEKPQEDEAVSMPAEESTDEVAEAEPVSEPEPVAEEEPEEKVAESSYEKTRRELQDLDDLDI
ncbi:MAG TPA: KH domain-containing protein [Candidatus Saccharibacteria bacterium]|nr:KH domain-containing protein [Candidatus Saccharibacteria bacterium]